MYICVCKGVTDTAIREAVHRGADRMRDLKTCLGVSEQCGRCACHAKEVLEKALMQKTLAQHIPQKPTRSYEISPEEA
jgi:bacterioferritin-associated ferredoxin